MCTNLFLMLISCLLWCIIVNIKIGLKKSLKLIRIRKSKKDRKHNGQKKTDKRTNNDIQNITHKTKDRVTRTPLQSGGEFWCSGRVSSFFSTSVRRNVKTSL